MPMIASRPSLQSKLFSRCFQLCSEKSTKVRTKIIKSNCKFQSFSAQFGASFLLVFLLNILKNHLEWQTRRVSPVPELLTMNGDQATSQPSQIAAPHASVQQKSNIPNLTTNPFLSRHPVHPESPKRRLQ